MPDTIDGLVTASRRPATASKPMVIDPDGRITYAELDATTRDLAAAFIAAGVGKGTRVGLIMPNCVQWVQIAVALTRIGAVLVPLSTLLQPPELVAATARRLRAVPRHRARSSAATATSTTSSRDRANLPALREVWTPDRLPRPPTAPPSTRSPKPSRPATRSRSCSRRAAAAHPKESSTRTAMRWARCGRAWPHAASMPTPGCTCRCRSSGWADSAAACCPRCWPAPRWSPSRSPGRRRRCGCWSANGSRCFVAGRTRPRRWRAKPILSAADLSSLRPGSLEALLPPDQRAEPGARAKLFGMTESFGPYCGYPRRHRHAAVGVGQLRKAVRRHGGSDRRPRRPARPLPAGTIGMIQIRGPHVMRGICRRSREDLFTADGYYPTGDLGHLDDDGFMFYHGRSDDMFKVSGATVYPERGRAGAAHHRRCRQRLRHRGLRGGRRRRDIRDGRRRPARRGAQAAERVQGSDGVAARRLRRRDPARGDGQGRRPPGLREQT